MSTKRPSIRHNDGWAYEIADPSVGIFGEGWYHEMCPATESPQIGEVDTDAETITCPHCGEVTR